MPLPTRIQAITPIQKYLQDTMLADTGSGGMMTLLASDGVYVNDYPPRIAGAPPTPKPNVLLSSATELGVYPSFYRVANENSQTVDIFTDEVASTTKLGLIYNRLLFLFDNKKPVITGFVAYRATRVEFTGSFPDADGVSTHAIAVISPQLRIA